MKRSLFVTGAVVFLALVGFVLVIFPVSWFPKFYDVRYMGWISFVEIALIMGVPKAMMVKETSPDSMKKNKAAYLLQMLLASVFLANVLGDLGLYELYKIGFQFDKVLHFFTPFAAVISIKIILEDRFGVEKLNALLIALFFTFGCGITWEILEVLADLLLKTHISGVYGLAVTNDTMWDLICDAAGSVVGAVLVHIFVKQTRKIFLRENLQAR